MIKQIEHTGKIKMSFDEEGGRIIEDTPVIVFEGELGSTNAIITDDSCYILLSIKMAFFALINIFLMRHIKCYNH